MGHAQLDVAAELLPVIATMLPGSCRIVGSGASSGCVVRLIIHSDLFDADEFPVVSIIVREDGLTREVSFVRRHG